MLRLTMQRESRWVELPDFGVRIKIRPLTTTVFAAARAEAAKRGAALWAEAKAQEAGGFSVDSTGPNITNPNWREGIVAQFHAEALLRYAAEEWEGVVGEDGAPLPINAASVAAFAEHDDASQAFLKNVYTDIEAKVAEGNASAPSSPGAGEGAAITAPDAARADAPPAPLS